MENIAFQGLTCFTVKLEVGRCDRSTELGVLLLESNPNPGYYSKQNFPPNKKTRKDRHCYLLVKNTVNCFQDIVLRHTRDVKKKFKHKLNVTTIQLTFQNVSYQCIRINTSEIELIPEFLSDLKSM